MVKVKASEVKSLLKKNGIETKKISVRSDWHSINITLKDLSLPITKIEKIVKIEFEKIDRCHVSGEILAGGNTFVFVDFDSKVVHEAVEQKVAEMISEGFDFDKYIENLKSKEDYRHVFKEDDKLKVIISLEQNRIFFEDFNEYRTIPFNMSHEGLAWAILDLEYKNSL